MYCVIRCNWFSKATHFFLQLNPKVFLAEEYFSQCFWEKSYPLPQKGCQLLRPCLFTWLWHEPSCRGGRSQIETRRAGEMRNEIQ